MLGLVGRRVVSPSKNLSYLVRNQFTKTPICFSEKYDVNALPVDDGKKTPQQWANDRSGWIYVDSHDVKCDGGEFGHPAVFYKIVSSKKPTVCGYCGKIYALRDHRHH
eukprot:c7168_g1_i1.p1 GENE.c7168_g1_i1~~c7168_g1_i1.p1  ORF type:complete len:108 (-),score=34.86 c7168_g1_i1:38-361(-)